MKAIRILLSIAMLIAAGLGAFNVIPLRTAYFTLIILVAITVSIRIIQDVYKRQSFYKEDKKNEAAELLRSHNYVLTK